MAHGSGEVESVADFVCGGGQQNEVYVLYADYVMKNPFYELDMPIKVDRWEGHLKTLVDRYSLRQGV